MLTHAGTWRILVECHVALGVWLTAALPPLHYVHGLACTPAACWITDWFLSIAYFLYMAFNKCVNLVLWCWLSGATSTDHCVGDSFFLWFAHGDACNFVHGGVFVGCIDDVLSRMLVLRFWSGHERFVNLFWHILHSKFAVNCPEQCKTIWSQASYMVLEQRTTWLIII